jgi:two-component system, NarL family, nitrate/nitrite response regulator NarL
MKPIALFLAADDPSLLRGLRMRLEIEAGFAIVGEAGALDGVAELADTLAPDVVVVDADAAAQTDAPMELVRSLAVTYRVVVLGLHDGRGATDAALEAGAAAFVTKHGPTATLVTAIRDAASSGQGAR